MKKKVIIYRGGSCCLIVSKPGLLIVGKIIVSITSITKCSVVIGSPRAYLIRN